MNTPHARPIRERDAFDDLPVLTTAESVIASRMSHIADMAATIDKTTRDQVVDMLRLCGLHVDPAYITISIICCEASETVNFPDATESVDLNAIADHVFNNTRVDIEGSTSNGFSRIKMSRNYKRHDGDFNMSVSTSRVSHV